MPLDPASNGTINLDELVRPPVKFEYQGDPYVLEPASEGTVIKMRQTVARRPRMVDGKVTSDLDRAQEGAVILLSMTLKDRAGKLVGEDVLRSWPSAVVDKLFVTAKEISDLDDKPKTRADWEKRLKEAEEALDKMRAEEDATVPN